MVTMLSSPFHCTLRATSMRTCRLRASRSRAGGVTPSWSGARTTMVLSSPIVPGRRASRTSTPTIPAAATASGGAASIGAGAGAASTGTVATTGSVATGEAWPHATSITSGAANRMRRVYTRSTSHHTATEPSR